MNRVLIAGTSSGCGKTTVTLALLAAFRKRGLDLCSFKCGPDYIDPIFHRELMGLQTRNLDPFFLDTEGLNRSLLTQNGHELAIIEGVMGYYDGLGSTTNASSYEVALKTKTPAILVMQANGMSASAGAIMRGFKSFKRDSGIKGVIFSGLNDKMYPHMKKLAESAGLLQLGFLPKHEELVFPSRHLGLATDYDKAELQRRLGLLGELAERSIELDGVLELAASAPPLPELEPEPKKPRHKVRIAVSRDEAFCFLYEENLLALEALGCELAFFSPLHDVSLPQGAGGLYLCGGYPELYAAQLSANSSMLSEIRHAISSGMPTVAECGGFMYLHKRLDGHAMVGAIPALAFETKSLKRFGYITLCAEKDSLLCKKGDELRSHEFHYWDSTDSGEGFTAVKASGNTLYPCVHTGETLYAGFPHLFFPACPEAAERFAAKSQEYAAAHGFAASQGDLT